MVENVACMLKKWLFALSFVLVLGAGQALPAHMQDDEPITFTGHIDDRVESQDFTVTLTEGVSVLVTTEAEGDDKLDTIVTVYDPSGEVVANNDDADSSTRDSRAVFLVRETGEYRINVTRYDKSTSGSYILRVETGSMDLLNYNVSLSGEPLILDTEHFRIHYTLSGVDAVDENFLEAIAQAFEDAYRIEVEQMGWPAPPEDDVMGGNALYDVYIMNTIGSGEDALGLASPELFVGDNPSTPEIETYAATSYIAIDNDFGDIDFDDHQNAVSVMRATAFHEYHHAIQFGFDAAEPHSWLLEATATWMETVGAGKDQDATGYISTAYSYPELCFGTSGEDGSVMYGEWTFMQFLTDEYGDDVMLRLWRAVADQEGFDAVSLMLEAYDATVPQVVGRYRLNNLARNYELAPLFDATVWLEETITDVGEWTYTGAGIQELGANYFEFDAPAGVYEVELRNDRNELTLWAIGLNDDGLDVVDLGRGGGIDTTGYERMYLMVFNPLYDNDVDSCSYNDYQIEVLTGKGTTNPVIATLNRTYFEPLS